MFALMPDRLQRAVQLIACTCGDQSESWGEEIATGGSFHEHRTGLYSIPLRPFCARRSNSGWLSAGV